MYKYHPYHNELMMRITITQNKGVNNPYYRNPNTSIQKITSKITRIINGMNLNSNGKEDNELFFTRGFLVRADEFPNTRIINVRKEVNTEGDMEPGARVHWHCELILNTMGVFKTAKKLKEAGKDVYRMIKLHIYTKLLQEKIITQDQFMNFFNRRRNQGVHMWITIGRGINTTYSKFKERYLKDKSISRNDMLGFKFDSNGNMYNNKGERYDLTSNSWKPTTNIIFGAGNIPNPELD